ncbi:MAG: hypothetical protein JSW66_18320 [Phycisphaerales bacterium]|nr:MAG: hypothetical protein JSW66_18320 [Phycisphaerales bacterium]
MKPQQVYDRWKRQKREIDVKPGFADEAMNRIHTWERERRSRVLSIERLVELVSLHPAVKTAFVAAGAMTGVVRLIIMVIVILSDGVANG